MSRIARDSHGLALAVPEVIAHRLTRAWLAGGIPAQRDRDEFHRMLAEKVGAFHESWAAMLREMLLANLRLALWPMWWAPWAITPARARDRLSAHHRSSVLAVLQAGLAPVHRRAVANARRLRRVRHY